jgi:hypothetical protein
MARLVKALSPFWTSGCHVHAVPGSGRSFASLSLGWDSPMRVYSTDLHLALVQYFGRAHLRGTRSRATKFSFNLTKEN